VVETANLAFELLVDRLDAGLEIVSFKNGAERHPQHVDEVMHLFLEDERFPLREIEGQGLVGLTEVVDVAPVSGRLEGQRLLVDERADDGVASGPLGTDHKQVEPLVLDADAELHRLQGAILADYPGDLMDLIGRFKGKHLQRALKTRTLGTDFPDWTVISTSIGSSETTYTDNTVTQSSSYLYAVIHRDLAYNYSTALVSGTITTPASDSPTITINPTSLTGFTYLEGSGPATSQSYNLSGSNLTGFPGNITITGSTDYEVSTDNTNFSNSVTVAYSNATLTSTPIYVRLKSELSAGNYYSETITNSGGGATVVNVTCNGSVTIPVYYFKVKRPETGVAPARGNHLPTTAHGAMHPEHHPA